MGNKSKNKFRKSRHILSKTRERTRRLKKRHETIWSKSPNEQDNIQKDRFHNDDNNLPNEMDDISDVTDYSTINPNVIDVNIATSNNDSHNIDAVVWNNDVSSSIKPLDQNLLGRRIVDAHYFINQILNFKHLGLFPCTNAYIEIIEEVKKGFFSKFVLLCKMCHTKCEIFSEPPKADTENINTSMVSSIVSIGAGYSQLKEFVSSLDMPAISFKYYNRLRELLIQKIMSISYASMIEAGKEEYQLAVDNGEVDKNGVPLIQVVADGAYIKRSYRTNYNSRSGVACIVGVRTNKILFLAVKNKFCSFCEMGGNTEHTCFKNFDGPSTAMESEAIVEGFKTSMDMHKLMYKFLIADGDSNVYKKICSSRPYADTFVEKIECKNHLLRNFCSKLRELVKKRFSSSGKLVHIELRTLLKNNVRRLRTAVESSIKHHMKRDVCDAEKKLAIRRDFGNSPYHIFGSHKNCDRYYCTKENENDNTIERMTECGMLDDIQKLINRPKFHAQSLLKYKNNNIAEHFNSIVAKFIGGKRVDYTKRGSYTLRCHAAASSYNSKGKFHDVLIRNITKQEPGTYATKFIEKKKKQRDNVHKRKLNFQNNGQLSKKPRRIHIVQEADENYGTSAANDPEISAEMLKERCDLYLQRLGENTPFIQNNTTDQRTCESWHTERRKRITASNFGRICKLRVTTDRSKVVKDLMFPNFSGNRYTQYGIDSEPLAIKELERQIGKPIIPCGLFIDSSQPYIAASPDGILDENTLIEIKCPYVCKNISVEEAISTGKIKFATLNQNNQLTLKTSHSYFYQVQGQLFVTKKKICLFVIWSPSGLLYEKIEFNIFFFENKMMPKLKEFYMDHMLQALVKEEIEEDQNI